MERKKIKKRKEIGETESHTPFINSLLGASEGLSKI